MFSLRRRLYTEHGPSYILAHRPLSAPLGERSHSAFRKCVRAALNRAPIRRPSLALGIPALHGQISQKMARLRSSVLLYRLEGGTEKTEQFRSTATPPGPEPGGPAQTYAPEPPWDRRPQPRSPDYCLREAAFPESRWEGNIATASTKARPGMANREENCIDSKVCYR